MSAEDKLYTIPYKEEDTSPMRLAPKWTVQQKKGRTGKRTNNRHPNTNKEGMRHTYHAKQEKNSGRKK